MGSKERAAAKATQKKIDEAVKTPLDVKDETETDAAHVVEARDDARERAEDAARAATDVEAPASERTLAGEVIEAAGDGATMPRAPAVVVERSGQTGSAALGAEVKAPILSVVDDYVRALAAEVAALAPRQAPPEVDARVLAESALAKRLHAAGAVYTLPSGRVVRGTKARDPAAPFASEAERAAFELRRYSLVNGPKAVDPSQL